MPAFDPALTTEPAHDTTLRAVARICWPQVLCWLGGIAALQVFFLRDWPVPMPWGAMSVHLHPGHVLLEAVSWCSVFLAGSILGGWWWIAARGAGHERAGLGGAAMIVWALLACIDTIGSWIYLAGLAAWIVVAAALTLRHWRARLPCVLAFLSEKRSWNLPFLALWILAFTTSDAIKLSAGPDGWIAAADFLLGRLLNHTFIAAALWLLLAWHERWTPPPANLIAWNLMAMVPLLVVINMLLQLMWGKGIVMLFGELEVGGEFDLHRALRAGGVEVTQQVVALAMAAVVVAVAVFHFCGKLSRAAGHRIHPFGLCALAAVTWTSYQAQQGAGLALKSRAWRWWEMKSSSIRMTPITTPPGIASFDVGFANPLPAVKPQTLAREPDIFLFVVETLRRDALRPDTTPFMCAMRDTDCQRLGETYAASNATHLSWFSILHGRLPLYWEEARQRAEVALLPAALRSAGYRVEARMVADYDYMEMLATNFGKDRQIDLIENLDENSREHLFKTPEREVRMLDRLAQSVESAPPGGRCFITAFDSPHYPYKWSDKFTPPITDYAPNPMFPLRPSADDVRRVQNRYWNSVAWIDHLVASFISKLKAQGRYDDSIIIITGDHGEEFKEEGAWFHCSALNPQQTCVPILIKWPASLGRGPDVKAASHLDIVPSILDALGFDEKTWRALPGMTLLRPREPRTIAMTTHYAGKNGESMMLIRDGWQAAFGWHGYWLPDVPNHIWLERVRSPEGPRDHEPSAAYLPLLRENFPDALETLFTRTEAR